MTVATPLVFPLARTMAGVVGDSAYPSSTSLLALNSKIVFLGDSITAARGFAGFADWSLGAAQGRFALPRTGSNGTGPTGWNQGVVGNTTTQMIARLSNVSAESPKSVVVMGGCNDITNSSGTFSSVSTNLRTIIDAIKAMGAIPVICTIIPGDLSTVYIGAMETIRQQVNDWIRVQTDIIVADVSAKITNTATQLSDGKHPNAIGAQLIGQSTGGLGDILVALTTGATLLYTSPAPSENLISNPFFTGGATVATGWSFFQNTNGLTKAASKSTDGIYETQRYVASGSATSANADNFNINITVPGLTGTIVEAWVELIVTKDTGLGSIGMGMGVNTAAGTMFAVTATDASTRSVPYRVVLRTPQFASTSDNQVYNVRLQMVPTNTATHDVDIAFSRSGYRVAA